MKFGAILIFQSCDHSFMSVCVFCLCVVCVCVCVCVCVFVCVCMLCSNLLIAYYSITILLVSKFWTTAAPSSVAFLVILMTSLLLFT